MLYIKDLDFYPKTEIMVILPLMSGTKQTKNSRSSYGKQGIEVPCARWEVEGSLVGEIRTGLEIIQWLLCWMAML